VASRRFAATAVLALSLLVALGPPARAAVPGGFEDSLVTKVDGALALAFTPDGRLLITGRTGLVYVYKKGALLPPALNISSRLCSDRERGMTGIAVDPDFGTNHYVYLYYTYKKLGTCDVRTPRTPVNRVARFTLRDDNVIDPGSELVLIDNIPSYGGGHNAGGLGFGKDGYLYVGIGDGYCDYARDSGCTGQNDAARDQHVLLGKVLRITASGSIPVDNPWLGADSARCNVTGSTEPGKKCQETWAWGLRNPFRFAFDPSATGTRLFINDVGDRSWEEIDLGQAGADYGWNLREGHCARGSTSDCGPPPAGMINPIYDYRHGRGDNCLVITGGAFVPPDIWPSRYDGAYLFADYICGKIQTLKRSGRGYAASEFADRLGPVIDLVFGPHGTGQALYYTASKFPPGTGGEVRRIAATLVAVPRTHDLRKALKNGIKLRLSCPRACRINAQLLLSRKTAHKLLFARGQKPVVVAKGSGRLTRPGTKSVRLKFTRTARKGLKRARRLRLSFRATVRQTPGGTKTLSRSLTLKRNVRRR
jgi:glucose/arabinose dehydrogenase